MRTCGWRIAGPAASSVTSRSSAAAGRSLACRRQLGPVGSVSATVSMPWISAQAREDCTTDGRATQLRLLTRSATNAYFAQTISVISLPIEEDELMAIVERHRADLAEVESVEDVRQARRFNSALRMALDGLLGYRGVRASSADPDAGWGREIVQPADPGVRRARQRSGGDRRQRTRGAALRAHAATKRLAVGR